jgi:hypothetical protein
MLTSYHFPNQDLRQGRLGTLSALRHVPGRRCQARVRMMRPLMNC